MNWRTAQSRSYLSIEIHQNAILTAVLRYQPCTNTAALRRFNETYGTTYPEDLPIDVLAAMLGLLFVFTSGRGELIAVVRQP